MIKEIFTDLIHLYNEHPCVAENLWAEIEKQYTGPKRYYHNLDHLQNMYSQLESCREQITDWDTILFSLFYHDVIYKVTSKENEEKSALSAIKTLTLINYPKDRIKCCSEQIIATKSHEMSPDNDTNLFIDADMSIIGTSPNDYNTYSKQIRKEYSIYPDFMYNPGRKKALQHFLDMEYIYKTKLFREKFEERARKNLLAELEKLS